MRDTTIHAWMTLVAESVKDQRDYLTDPEVQDREHEHRGDGRGLLQTVQNERARRKAETGRDRGGGRHDDERDERRHPAAHDERQEEEDRYEAEERQHPNCQRRFVGDAGEDARGTQLKVSAASILPVPRYRAVLGYAQIGRVRSATPFERCDPIS